MYEDIKNKINIVAYIILLIIYFLLSRVFIDYLQKCVEFPKILCQIMNLVGYDHPIAVKGLNANSILEIEKYVSENLKEELVNSIYSNMARFTFLPGHKTILLSLPSYVDEFERITEKKALIVLLTIFLSHSL